MPSLKTSGFARLVAEAAAKARLTSEPEKAISVALTLDGRLPEPVGRKAVRPADRLVLAVAAELAAGPDLLVLTPTGRLATCQEPPPEDAHMLLGLRWPESLRAEWHAEVTRTRHELAEVEPPTVDALDRIAYALTHMAPVLFYVDDRVYTNLDKSGSLPGKSLSVDDPRCLLRRLRERPVDEWDPVDTCFVVCLDALLASGPPVRAEEFNGAQLLPGPLREFLTGRITAYGALPSGSELGSLAAQCAAARAAALDAGATPYRVINGLNLHKREELLPEPAPVPWPIARQVARFRQARYAPAGFGSGFEAALHDLLRLTAEEFEADVAMSRGPRRLPALLDDPFALRTNDFFCCVVPRAAFDRWFGGDRDGLARALAAYSARMRFNTWHYLPHSLGIADARLREDWFFAPTMPDITEWSDQQHTGHVAFGVRHAIRVPFGITHGGRFHPGLYDLRLMRTGSPPFTVADLRGAIAVAGELARLYEEFLPDIDDFDRDWYQRFHSGRRAA